MGQAASMAEGQAAGSTSQEHLVAILSLGVLKEARLARTLIGSVSSALQTSGVPGLPPKLVIAASSQIYKHPATLSHDANQLCLEMSLQTPES